MPLDESDLRSLEVVFADFCQAADDFGRWSALKHQHLSRFGLGDRPVPPRGLAYSLGYPSSIVRPWLRLGSTAINGPGEWRFRVVNSANDDRFSDDGSGLGSRGGSNFEGTDVTLDEGPWWDEIREMLPTALSFAPLLAAYAGDGVIAVERFREDARAEALKAATTAVLQARSQRLESTDNGRIDVTTQPSHEKRRRMWGIAGIVIIGSTLLLGLSLARRERAEIPPAAITP